MKILNKCIVNLKKIVKNHEKKHNEFLKKVEENESFLADLERELDEEKDKLN